MFFTQSTSLQTLWFNTAYVQLHVEMHVFYTIHVLTHPMLWLNTTYVQLHLEMHVFYAIHVLTNPMLCYAMLWFNEPYVQLHGKNAWILHNLSLTKPTVQLFNCT